MPDEMYNPESLRRGIEACDKNIAVFEEAIRKEEETKRQYREFIRRIEEKKAEAEAVKKHVVIEVADDADRS